MVLLHKNNFDLAALSFTSVLLFGSSCGYFGYGFIAKIILILLYVGSVFLAHYIQKNFDIYYLIKSSYVYILPILIPCTMGLDNGLGSHLLYLIAFFFNNLICLCYLFKKLKSTETSISTLTYVIVGAIAGLLLSIPILGSSLIFSLALVLSYYLIPFEDQSLLRTSRFTPYTKILLFFAALIIIKLLFFSLPINKYTYIIFIFIYPICATLSCCQLRANNHVFSLGLLAIVLAGLLPMPTSFTSSMLIDNVDVIMICSITLFIAIKNEVVYSTHSKFGHLKVVHNRNNRFYLYHNDTLHGMEYITQSGKFEYASYYNENAPMGQICTEYLPTTTNIAVIGLGVGSMASYTSAGQVMDFYEIDKQVEFIARKYFHALSSARAKINVIIGDARKTITMAENHKYDLIISDAYTGQNIPLHLLSFEAINVFMSKLTPEGILCMHISSNTKEALYNIAKVAEVMGLECLHQYYDLQSKPQGKEAHLGLFPVGKQSEIIKITEICKRILHYFLDLHKLFPAEHHTSRCIILTRDPQNFSKLKDLNKWQKIQIPAGTKLLRDEAISYNPFI